MIVIYITKEKANGQNLPGQMNCNFFLFFCVQTKDGVLPLLSNHRQLQNQEEHLPQQQMEETFPMPPLSCGQWGGGVKRRMGAWFYWEAKKNQGDKYTSHVKEGERMLWASYNSGV